MNIAPTFAWRPSERLSLGLGVVLQSFNGEFENSIDVGYLVAEQVIEEVARTAGLLKVPAPVVLAVPWLPVVQFPAAHGRAAALPVR